ncbi:M20 family metallopeptidase [Ureibacillus sp. NPDC094379]
MTTITTLKEQVITWRRTLHQEPELSFEEVKTAQFIEDQLRQCENFIVTRPTNTSVMAVLKGQERGKVIAFRADIDALPIQEETDVAFRSQVAGVMHACGHDAHAAMLLGAAYAIHDRGTNFAGEIRFLFQHAEEVSPGGAEQMVAQGVLEEVEHAFALHVSPNHLSGQLAYRKKAISSAADDFDITIFGSGGHAGMPAETIDPLLIGSEIVQALQTIVSRKIANGIAPVLSVTKFNCGTANNIIADQAELGGTIRSHHEKTRVYARELLEQTVHGIAQTHGATASITWELGCSAVFNDSDTTDISITAASKIFENIIELEQPMFGTEDFAIMAEQVPSSYQFIGVHHEKLGEAYPLHHPKFNLDENALILGTSYYVEIAKQLCPIEQ